MPVIIDEVIVSVEVQNRESGGAASQPSGTEDRQALIAECVERVLDVLARKAER